MVSIAKSAYFCCLPRFPDGFDFHYLMALGDNHNVRFPLFRIDYSYLFQLLTLYFGLYLGLRLRLWDSFIVDSSIGENLIKTNDSCTNAIPLLR